VCLGFTRTLSFFILYIKNVLLLRCRSHPFLINPSTAEVLSFELFVNLNSVFQKRYKRNVGNFKRSSSNYLATPFQICDLVGPKVFLKKNPECYKTWKISYSRSWKTATRWRLWKKTTVRAVVLTFERYRVFPNKNTKSCSGISELMQI